MESIIQIGESQLGGFLSLNAQNQNQTMDTNGNRQRKSSTSDFEQFPEPIIKSIEIHIRRVSDETGFGFNIVGGVSSPHIPGHRGIFVSKIRPDSPAAYDGRLAVGDRILTVNGICLSDKTHDEAANIFRQIGKDCIMQVEPEAERILLSQPSNLIIPGSGSPTQTAKANASRPGSRASSPVRSGSRARSPSSPGEPISKQLKAPIPEPPKTSTPKGSPGSKLPVAITPKGSSPEAKISMKHVTSKAKETPLVLVANGMNEVVSPSPFQSKLAGKKNKEHEKFEEQASMPVVQKSVQTAPVHPASDSAPNARSERVVDDIPPTPKKPVGLLDSPHSDTVFVVIGVVALGVGLYAGYRYFYFRRA